MAEERIEKHKIESRNEHENFCDSFKKAIEKCISSNVLTEFNFDYKYGIGTRIYQSCLEKKNNKLYHKVGNNNVKIEIYSIRDIEIDSYGFPVDREYEQFPNDYYSKKCITELIPKFDYPDKMSVGVINSSKDIHQDLLPTHPFQSHE